MIVVFSFLFVSDKIPEIKDITLNAPVIAVQLEHLTAGLQKLQ